MSDKCFFSLPGQNKAMKYFAKKYQIPVIDDPTMKKLNLCYNSKRKEIKNDAEIH